MPSAFAVMLMFVLVTSVTAQAPRASMVVTQSLTFEPGTYRVEAPERGAAITVRGDGIVVDFNGATLVGSDDPEQPDRFAGVAVLVEGGRNVTIRNLRVRGFKVGVLARNSPSLKIEHCDLSYNYRPRLFSTRQKEDERDWLSFHRNESDQWLRYGAGIYLRDCNWFDINHCVVTGGFNGLLISHGEGGKVWNNRFHFNSGVGLGLYAVSRTAIMHNILDFNVRGYSHGVYARGQDSAGVLVFEQSSNNLFAYNSATHGGDGFFLWAGQTTMDSGWGGSNDNLLYANDFSHAAANGVEMTFSRNFVVNNRIDDSEHGIWGGYSADSLILCNSLSGNRVGIAIEHGQQNRIANNRIGGGQVGIQLFARAEQPKEWGYPKQRDVRSRDYEIVHNQFVQIPLAIDLSDTINVRLTDNGYDNIATPVRASGKTDGLVRDAGERFSVGIEPALLDDWEMPFLTGGQDWWLPVGFPRGRQYILMDEWGPYDFRRPLAVRRETNEKGLTRIELLGPQGRWELLDSGDAVAASSTGNVPGDLLVRPGESRQLKLKFVFVGAETTDRFGRVTPKGQRVEFDVVE